MRILIVDDKQCELDKACEAAAVVAAKRNMVIEVVMINTSKGAAFERIARAIEGGVDAVVTDLLFNPLEGSHYYKDWYGGDNVPPAGLMVAMLAVAKRLPVCICSDSQEGKLAQDMTAAGYVASHKGQFGWIKDGVFNNSYKLLPLRLEATKNWEHAIMEVVAPFPPFKY